MLRISGGYLAGRRFKAPAGGHTRPTADRVKEALFAILGYRVEVKLAADLFAGSGGLGLEALSRGAGHCIFVERQRQVVKLLCRNLKSLGLWERATVIRADAGRPGPRLLSRGACPLVLADPPYEQGEVSRVCRLAGRGGLLAPGGWLVIEHSPRERPSQEPDLRLEDRRAYGQTEISFLYREP